MMKLMFGSKEVGEIYESSREGVWMVASIELTEYGKTLTDFFEFLTDEEKGNEEPAFDEDLLDDSNWWIDEGGQRKPIDLPAVHIDDNSVYWRWA